MNKMTFALLALLMALSCGFQLLVQAPQTPIWPMHFQEDFVEAYGNAGIFRTSGKYWFDAERKSMRLDRHNGMHDPICGSIIPNVSTHCTMLTLPDLRYIYFPDKRLCCVCCDAEHGCGPLKRDWLSTSKYEGKQTLLDQTFDKWSILDGDVLDYYWATQDERQVPRKLDEGGSRIKEFIMESYKEQKAKDSVFALPSYCDKKVWCPSTSICKRLQ